MSDTAHQSSQGGFHPLPWALYFVRHYPGVPLRCTPGFMLSPAGLKSIRHGANLELFAKVAQRDCGVGAELDFDFLAWD